jgi:hypothetical protein
MATSTTTPAANPHQNPHLTEPDRPIYAVCRLMRQLPDDITNARALTHDEAQKAAAVEFYSDAIRQTIAQGVLEIGGYLQESKPDFAATMPHFAALLQYLGVESQCMREISADYGAASAELASASASLSAAASSIAPPAAGQTPASGSHDSLSRLLAAHHAMHAVGQGIGAAFLTHLARVFPLDESVKPCTAAQHCSVALADIAMFSQLAIDLHALRGTRDLDRHDKERFKDIVDDRPSGLPLENDVLVNLQFELRETPRLHMPEARLLTICDLLIVEWLRLFLHYGLGRDYLPQLVRLVALNDQLVKWVAA